MDFLLIVVSRKLPTREPIVSILSNMVGRFSFEESSLTVGEIRQIDEAENPSPSKYLFDYRCIFLKRKLLQDINFAFQYTVFAAPSSPTGAKETLIRNGQILRRFSEPLTFVLKYGGVLSTQVPSMH